MTTNNEKSIATLLHLSVLIQYFIPLGNYIFPIVIWSAKKNESEFVNANGKNVLNFQLSLFLYTVVLCLIAIPILIYSIFKNVPLHDIHFNDDFIINHLSGENITGLAILGIVAVLLFCFLKVIEFILTIYAAVKASNGEAYKYPLSITFFK
ncbi:DUF4870 domain-containing protein [Flavobacterium terrisoli]|uniref:DUF4870 domain-containing protein n=1 Tax=Flavobacterium terrisoli TaxID=3242195 RepID=UPI002542D750|nr:DUF4870 domain-containing protein [Flavobacterium buctense]